MERRLLFSADMQLQLDADQVALLEEVLEANRKQLMVESARADSHDFREELHAREDKIEALLAQLHAAH
jgi:glycine cleavage system regulatory protein